MSHLTPAVQLQAKREQVVTALGEFILAQPPVVNPTKEAQPREGYRIRAKLVHHDGILGLYADNHQVVDTQQCKILHPNLRTALNAVRALLPLPCPLLAVDARVADDGVLITLIVPPQTSVATLDTAAQHILAAHKLIRGVAYSERGAQSVQVLGGLPQHLAGAHELIHHLTPGAPYHLAVPGGFVQAHAQQAATLHATIEGALRTALGSLSKANVVELYAGAGALALRLAAHGARVTAIESFGPSVALLERTAREQALSLRAVNETAETALTQLVGADAIIVDPPRRGLSVAVRTSVASAKPRVVVYVSCDPRTLARDLAHFAWLGYAASEVHPFDLMPHSDAVETLAVLTPAPTPQLEVVYRDDALVAVNKPPHIPTTPHAEYPTSLLRLVQTLDGCQAAAPVHRLDVGTSGVCLFATSPERVQAIATALTNGRKTYTALAQGIAHKRGTIRQSLLEGRTPRSAETEYKRVGVLGTHSLIEAHPKQGRKHQIRRHFAKIGHALAGDAKYGSAASCRHFFERHGLDRPFLHLGQVELPFSNSTLVLTAPLACDLEAVARTLTLTATNRKSS